MSYEQILAVPRLAGLRVSPDGKRAMVSVTAPSGDGRQTATDLCEVSLETAARRVIQHAGMSVTEGAYLHDGGLALAGRRSTDVAGYGLSVTSDGDGAPAAVVPWPAPISMLRSARGAQAIAFLSPQPPPVQSSTDLPSRARAAHFGEAPARWWDHYAEPPAHLFLAVLDRSRLTDTRPVDLTPHAGSSLEGMAFDIAPDAGQVAATVRRSGAATRLNDLVAYSAENDPAILTSGDAWYQDPRYSPDGRYLAAVRRDPGTVHRVAEVAIWIIDLSTGESILLPAGDASWPNALEWAHDSAAIYYVAPAAGLDAVFRADIASGKTIQMTRDGSYSDLNPARDGALLALRSTFSEPPTVVRLEPDDRRLARLWPDSQPSRVPATGTVARTVAGAPDCGSVPYWLHKPLKTSAEQAPLVVLCNAYVPHSWTNRWYFRWHPSAYTSAGYAVAAPDLSPSLGYGPEHLARGWGRWTDVALADLLAVAEHAAQDPDVDGTRIALIGGGWGGWLTAWAAANSDLFRAIVTQGGAWNMYANQSAADGADRWDEQLGDRFAEPGRYWRASPASVAAQLRAPVLIVTGDRDFRSPADDAIAMFNDLRALDSDAHLLFLYGEGHRIGSLAAEHAWYGSIMSFLGHYLCTGSPQRTRWNGFTPASPRVLCGVQTCPARPATSRWACASEGALSMLLDLPLAELRAYRPQVREPADFGPFWAAQLKAAAEFDLTATFEPMRTPIRSAAVYDAAFAGYGGNVIKGWLLLPDNMDDGAPVIVEFVGYGGGRGHPLDWLPWSSAGYPHLVMDTRGQGGTWRSSDTADPADGGEPHSRGFLTRGIISPGGYYYTRLFIDAARAVSAATAHPATAGRQVVTVGGSQGGGLAIAAAHLGVGVVATMPDVPFLANLERAAEVTDASPYCELTEYCAANPDRAEQAFTTLSYVDVVNHAKRVSCPALFSVGLMDPVTPPSTVYAAYNHYAGPKDIRVYRFNGHEGGRTHQLLAKLEFAATAAAG